MTVPIMPPGVWTGDVLDCARCYVTTTLLSRGILHVISLSGCEYLQLHLILPALSFLSSKDSSTRHLCSYFWERVRSDPPLWQVVVSASSSWNRDNLQRSSAWFCWAHRAWASPCPQSGRKLSLLPSPCSLHSWTACVGANQQYLWTKQDWCTVQ